MDRYEALHSPLTIGLLRGLYLAIIMDSYEGNHSALSIYLLRDFFLAIITDQN
jgi:hypothetical protein